MKAVTYEAFGEIKNRHEWVRDHRCSHGSVHIFISRVRKGWLIEDAITTPRIHQDYVAAWGETKSLKEWIEDPRSGHEITKQIGHRIRSGWTAEDAISRPLYSNPAYAAFGESKTLREWSQDERCLHKSYELIKGRVSQNNFSIEDAITQPKNIPKLHEAWGEFKTLSDWCNDDRCLHGETYIVKGRLRKGWSLEDSLSLPNWYNFSKCEAFGEEKFYVDWAKDERCPHKSPWLISRRIKAGISNEEAITVDKQRLKLYEAFNESRSIFEWSIDKRCVVSHDTLKSRVYAGWDFVEALTSPVQEKLLTIFGEVKRTIDWVHDDRCLVSEAAFRSRLYDGWEPEAALGTHKQNISQGELQLREAIFSFDLDLEILYNCRDIISPYELDIYIPSLNLAIEYNGVYWHSNKFLNRDAHYNKYLRCLENGIRLIQVWEDDWKNNKSYVMEKLYNCLNNIPLNLSQKEVTIDLSYDDPEPFYASGYVVSEGLLCERRSFQEKNLVYGPGVLTLTKT